jgi:hypothetical protein
MPVYFYAAVTGTCKSKRPEETTLDVIQYYLKTGYKHTSVLIWHLNTSKINTRKCLCIIQQTQKDVVFIIVHRLSLGQHSFIKILKNEYKNTYVT